MLGPREVASIAVQLGDELNLLRQQPGGRFTFSLMLRWASEDPLRLECCAIGDTGRHRIHLPEAERIMVRSLERYGQLSPVVVCCKRSGGSGFQVWDRCEFACDRQLHTSRCLEMP